MCIADFISCNNQLSGLTAIRTEVVEDLIVAVRGFDDLFGFAAGDLQLGSLCNKIERIRRATQFAAV